VPLDDTFEHTTDIGSLNSSRILRDLCLQIVFLEKAKSPTFVRPAARPEGKGVKVLAHDRISESDVTPPHRRACVVPAPVPVPVTGALLVQPCAYILTERPGSLTSRSTSSHTMMWFQSCVHPSRVHPSIQGICSSNSSTTKQYKKCGARSTKLQLTIAL